MIRGPWKSSSLATTHNKENIINDRTNETLSSTQQNDTQRFNLNSNIKEDFLNENDFLAALKPLNDDEETSNYLTNDDFINAKKLEINKSHISPSLAKQKYFHGDIRGKAAWTTTQKNGIRRNGVISVIKKWPNGRIPYIISSQYTSAERAVLAKAIQEYHTRTCIRFVPKATGDSDYLYIGKIDGCFSDVGRAGGRQELSLDNGCLQYDTAIHELMHSVGFYHEHERWDRDTYISILWNNIDREAYDQFGKVDLTESSYYGQNYDYRSIMHYDSMAFSKNGFETLVSKTAGMTPIMGSAIDFSEKDLYKINKMYRCTAYLQETSAGIMTQGKEQTNRYSVYNNLNRLSSIPPLPIIPLAPVTTARVYTTVPTRPFSPFVTPRPIKPISSTTLEPCVDKTNLCWRWIDRCTSFFFKKVMQEFCGASCGFCTPGVKFRKIKKSSFLTETPFAEGQLYSESTNTQQRSELPSSDSLNGDEESPTNTNGLMPATEELLKSISVSLNQRFG
uniref:Metalloendopeptidase n=1 Tax=Rhabditophanes sp. KR3021 TaxID=114890 RepID=A0AC35U7G6_9BILA